ncbi:hypothetical protein KFL_000500400 [Klebsormidium nitens]|uniref:Uncharacterized protein n=1 Tax=Klebsormidium nitens TaxID=105231 RepID=A0A1Y1HUS2_KLENI|nr:hypothetical protein KFL_000500400 [Klebsormidium nitens]|eukprot:GAQ80287.1 hypothetical protein KFL_000500400 [Klebsormidium nitens]
MAVCEEDACSSTASVESPTEEPLLLLCPRKGDDSGDQTGSTQSQGSGLSMQDAAQVQSYARCPPWGPGSSFRRVQELCQWLGCLLLVKIDQCKFGGRRAFNTKDYEPCKPFTAKLQIGPNVGAHFVKIPNKHLFDIFARQCDLWEHSVGTENEYDKFLLYRGKAMAKVLGMDLDELPPVTVSQYVSKEHCRGVEVQKLELIYNRKRKTIKIEVFCTPYFGEKQWW